MKGRQLIYSSEFLNFIENCTPRTKEKLLYATSILQTIVQIPSKFVKKLKNTDFYELRISAENEVRVILFTTGSDNINLAQQIIFLNAFIKKSTKDYKQEIQKAINILRKQL
ncbi:MAG: type II toxin-antitoxin system RelE/ParE family toxin [Bacteroidales bacterium]|nr:type II toxin-antitoxin system RelE/ParE family toxin [Bacteroidales bacterium]